MPTKTQRRVAKPVATKRKRPQQGATILTLLVGSLYESIDVLSVKQQEEVLAFIRTLKHDPSMPKPNGTAVARIMREGARKNLFSGIKDSLAWQRKIRKDRPLTGRR